ncbi:MAG TPA: cyclic nucleotide-binding domain-containing protein [Vicinamibacteria bacterium]|jgi:CRP-like cAMP-binding protein
MNDTGATPAGPAAVTGRIDAAVALLGEYGLFREVSDAQVQAIARSLKRLSLPAGAYLVREGERARELFLIERGAVEILKRESGQAREHVVGTAGRGEVIGEIALIGLGARTGLGAQRGAERGARPALRRAAAAVRPGRWTTPPTCACC